MAGIETPSKSKLTAKKRQFFDIAIEPHVHPKRFKNYSQEDIAIVGGVKRDRVFEEDFLCLRPGLSGGGVIRILAVLVANRSIADIAYIDAAKANIKGFKGG
ncbi:hypothetical protein [Vacuolonema iberomarrocanum]|uniref:hypothetical protein n=1 Tax=Vacuolonema iberomarrocanum TaxID=3454632 RepID=UPI003F6DBC91